jgi:tricorn protease
LQIGALASGADAHTLVVTPISDETLLRNHAWAEDNRRKVDTATGGRVAYVYLPDVMSRGYRDFNRYYFAQVGKEAAIIDDRFNHGGGAAEYVIDNLARTLQGYWHMREGDDLTLPVEGIFGPKVMLTNEMAGSGGDMLPWLFKNLKIGPLVGKRSWGGLTANALYPDDLLDGTVVTTPDMGAYDVKGKWAIENQGISPDFEVDDSLRSTEDPQLTKAIAVALDLLKGSATSKPTRPPFPNYHQND